MQWHVNLNKPFSYTDIGLIILIITIFIILLAVIFYYLKTRPPKVKQHVIKDINKTKKDFIVKIDSLIKEINENKITQRKAYNTLSIIIREFTFETTNIDVMKYTLFDIKQLNNPELEQLLREYYEPEFSKEGKGDLKSSIEKTRKVIREWK